MFTGPTELALKMETSKDDQGPVRITRAAADKTKCTMADADPPTGELRPDGLLPDTDSGGQEIIHTTVRH